jgi:hypothetical protein
MWWPIRVSSRVSSSLGAKIWFDLLCGGVFPTVKMDGVGEGSSVSHGRRRDERHQRDDGTDAPRLSVIERPARLRCVGRGARCLCGRDLARVT